jgi:hypothetical protein
VLLVLLVRQREPAGFDFIGNQSISEHRALSLEITTILGSRLTGSKQPDPTTGYERGGLNLC